MPAEIWQPQIDYFAHNFHVVALDPRSLGKSAKPTEGNYSERRAQDIHELLTHLQLAPAMQTPSNSAFALIAGFLARDDMSSAMGKVDKPVLVTVTADHRVAADLAKRHIPNAQTEIFEDAGHALFVDDAVRFNATMEKFVTSLPPR
jgi:pimeloyl-ACP methyl ester carboxylesterase